MYGTKIRYLASVFVDAMSITPTAKNIAGLAGALNDDSFLPMVVQERSVSAPYRNRIGFMTEKSEWRLLLGSTRFDLSLHPTDQEASNLGDFNSFCQQAMSKLVASLNYFERKAFRLAAVQEGTLPEMSPNEIDVISTRLFQYPHIYSTHRPFEWDWRAASLIEREICELIEPTNTITTIKRHPGKMVSIEREGEKEKAVEVDFQRVRVDFDINTTPENIIARFEERHIQDFFQKVGMWHSDLSSEIFSFILGKDNRS